MSRAPREGVLVSFACQPCGIMAANQSRPQSASVDELTLPQPDDWHLHLRDGGSLATTVAHAARQFARAIVMPNLRPPLTTTDAALAYRQRILAARPPGSSFEPLMTLYLTDRTSPAEIRRAHEAGIVAVKLYPAGATTHSDHGVTDLNQTYDTLATMAELGMPLLIHGEVTGPAVDIFDRERLFLDRHLAPLVTRFPDLKIVLEHITTAQAVTFVRQAPATVAATITAHHLLLNRNDLLAGGIRPHHYCLPVVKREQDRQALLQAATAGEPKFFLGTDSAPHGRSHKETACGCAGIYTAPVALALYAEVFEAMGALDKLAGFASHWGPDFYGLPRNPGRVTLIRKPTTVPNAYTMDNDEVVPLRAGETLAWRLCTA